MSTTVLPPVLKICGFEGLGVPKRPYLCLQHELCCKEGCCVLQTVRFFQSWYFWVAILVTFGIYRYASWYCSTMAIRTRDRLHQATVRQSSSDTESIISELSPHLEQTHVSNAIATKAHEPPPNYHDAVNCPKPDQIPSYEQAIKYFP